MVYFYLRVAVHKSKDKLKVQVEPFSILLCSSDLCLWKSAHWLPGSHPKSLVKHLHSSLDGLAEFQDPFWQGPKPPAEKWAKDNKSAQWHIENAIKICFQRVSGASSGSFGAFHCNDSLEDGSRFELPEVHVSQLCWTPGIPACSWKDSRGQVSTTLPLEAGVLLHYGFPGDPSLKAPRMPPLAQAEHSPGQTPQDVQTWDSCQTCVGRWCPGTPTLP